MLIDEKYLTELIVKAVQPLLMTPDQVEEIATNALASALAFENHSRVEKPIETKSSVTITDPTGSKTVECESIEEAIEMVTDDIMIKDDIAEETTFIDDTVEEVASITLDEFMAELKKHLREQDDVGLATRNAKATLKDMFGVDKFKDVEAEDLGKLLAEITK